MQVSEAEPKDAIFSLSYCCRRERRQPETRQEELGRKTCCTADPLLFTFLPLAREAAPPPGADPTSKACPPSQEVGDLGREGLWVGDGGEEILEEQ